MFILELFEPTAPGYQTHSDDNSVAKKSDSRKTRLTLAHLNQLRQSHDVRKVEHEKKLKQVSKQYQVPAEGAGGPAL
jgi:uncharacterized protein YkwD